MSPIIALRSKSKLELWEIMADGTSRAFAEIEDPTDIIATAWSPDKSVLAVNGKDTGLTVWTLGADTNTCPEVHSYSLPLPEEIKVAPARQLKWLNFSPKGTFLTGCWVTNGCGFEELKGNNCIAWALERKDNRIAKANIIHECRWEQRNMPLTWSSDEKFQLTISSDGRTLSFSECGKTAFEIRLNSARFEIKVAPSPGFEGKELITLFSPAKPEGKAELTMVLINAKTSSIEWVQTRALTNVDGCEIMWSPSGKTCVLMTSRLVDTAGENYGGVTDAWLCTPYVSGPTVYDSTLKSMALPDQRCGLLKVTKLNFHVVHAAKWSPTCDEFIMIQGKAQSEVCLFDSSGKRKQVLNFGYRNHICWSPHGDAVAVGGFGNFAGDITFYYKHAQGMKVMAEWRESCTVVCDWSSCGNFFFTASIRPRMNVDNLVTIWDRFGKKVSQNRFEQLFGVVWTGVPGESLERPPVPALEVLKEITHPLTVFDADDGLISTWKGFHTRRFGGPSDNKRSNRFPAADSTSFEWRIAPATSKEQQLKASGDIVTGTEACLQELGTNRISSEAQTQVVEPPMRTSGDIPPIKTGVDGRLQPGRALAPIDAKAEVERVGSAAEPFKQVDTTTTLVEKLQEKSEVVEEEKFTTQDGRNQEIGTNKPDLSSMVGGPSRLGLGACERCKFGSAMDIPRGIRLPMAETPQNDPSIADSGPTLDIFRPSESQIVNPNAISYHVSPGAGSLPLGRSSKYASPVAISHPSLAGVDLLESPVNPNKNARGGRIDPYVSRPPSDLRNHPMNPFRMAPSDSRGFPADGPVDCRGALDGMAIDPRGPDSRGFGVDFRGEQIRGRPNFAHSSMELGGGVDSRMNSGGGFDLRDRADHSDRAKTESDLLRLLQSILPSNARVKFGSDSSNAEARVEAERVAKQEHLMQLLRQAGVTLPRAETPRGGSEAERVWQYVDPKGVIQVSVGMVVLVVVTLGSVYDERDACVVGEGVFSSFVADTARSCEFILCVDFIFPV